MKSSIRPIFGTALPGAVARETRERLQADLSRVSDDVRPLVVVIAERLFEHELDANLVRRLCSPSRLTLKRFREQLGWTLWAYITERRMAAAERLLATTDLKVWQVAEAVGCLRKDFAAQFKRARGRSPREVRQAAGSHRTVPPAAKQRLDGRSATAQHPPGFRRTSITLTVVEPAPEEGAGTSVTVYFYNPETTKFVNARDLSDW